MVDKGPGLVVHPARGHREATLAQLLGASSCGRRRSRARGDRPSARPRHLGPARRRALRGGPPAAAGRARRAADRTRVPGARARAGRRRAPGTIDAPIGRDPRVRTRMAVGGARPREARTHFTLERALAGASLLRVRLETGRTHQIRVHLQAIGHPVCGDPEYGTPGLLGLERQFLHATRLAFDHPLTRRARRGRSPLPADLVGARAARRAERAILSRAQSRPSTRAGCGSRPCPVERRSSREPPGPLHPRGNQLHT